MSSGVQGYNVVREYEKVRYEEIRLKKIKCDKTRRDFIAKYSKLHPHKVENKVEEVRSTSLKSTENVGRPKSSGVEWHKIGGKHDKIRVTFKEEYLKKHPRQDSKVEEVRSTALKSVDSEKKSLAENKEQPELRAGLDQTNSQVKKQGDKNVEEPQKVKKWSIVRKKLLTVPSKMAEKEVEKPKKIVQPLPLKWNKPGSKTKQYEFSHLWTTNRSLYNHLWYLENKERHIKNTTKRRQDRLEIARAQNPYISEAALKLLPNQKRHLPQKKLWHSTQSADKK